MSQYSLKAVYQELQRRRLLNTVALYVVGAWVTLQVAELALPGLGIPDIAIRYVWIGVFILFPLVLIFGWYYDISSKGIKRTLPLSDPEADSALRVRDYWAIGACSAIVLAVAAMMVLRISEVEQAAPLPAAENSIAVLPFVTCADQQRDQVLASGITSEVMNRLAERGRFKVFARTSTYTVASFGLSVAATARSLGSEYVLVGELCRGDSGELALAAELFDTDGFVVWGEPFVQVVNPFDQVTDRLATLVATGAATHLGDVFPSVREPALNKSAYEQNVIGWEYIARQVDDKARAAFEKALTYEPEYADAKFGLAVIEFGPFGSSDEGARFERARPVLEEALELARRELAANDRDAETHLIVARIMNVQADLESQTLWRKAEGADSDDLKARKVAITEHFAEAERHFRTAITLNPSLTQAYVWLADTIEQQGVERASEALQVLERAQERDPLNVRVNTRIAKRWAARGRFRQAIELLDRFKALPEIPQQVWWWQLELMTLQTYWADKGETLIEMLLNDPGAFDGPSSGNRWQAWWFAGQLAALGLHEEAEGWYQRLEHIPLNTYLYEIGRNAYLDAMGAHQEIIETKAQRLADMSDEEVLNAYSGSVSHAAYVLTEQGDYERAIKLMESAQHAPAIWSERAPNYVMQLANLYLDVGRVDDAAPLLDRVRIQLETEFADGVRHPETLASLAEVYLLQGRDDDALDMLRKAVDYHMRESCEDGMISASSWGRLRDDPRLINLCERMQADLHQQAERLRKLLRHYDMDELLAPLMAMAAEGRGE